MSELTVHNKSNGFKGRRQKSVSFTVSKRDLIAVTEHAPDVICRFDRSFRLLYVNPAIEVATGIPPQAFINKTTRELGMPDEHSTDWEEKISYVVSTGKQTSLEFPFLTPAHGLRFFHAVLVPEFTDDGMVETVLTISRDITEKKELEKKRDETVSYVSHELKSPVTSLKISTQILKRKFDNEGNAKLAEQLGKMDRQLDRLTNIINDLMDTTRIENGSMKLHREEFEMKDLIKEIVDDIQKISSRHTIKIQGKSHKPAWGDRQRISQVITNLLSNAIHYSPTGTIIIVSISSDPNGITCSVKDHGIGIPKEQQARIFERFYRVKDLEQAFHMGLGLGLYICNEIIRKHKGQIGVKSEYGKGSTFSFFLPHR